MSGVLEVRGVRVSAGGVPILAGVDLEVWPGSAVGLVGPNGAGKTTLLDAVSGLVPLSAGSVLLGGTDLSGLPPHRRARLGLGRTFQGLELFDDLSVRENLQVPAEATGRAGADGAGAGGHDPDDDRLPATLGHDERKSLALSRAVAGGARTLLLDEPAAGLDHRGRRDLVARLSALVEGGAGVLLADHDLDLVLGFCERVYVLDFGRIIASGTPSSVRSDARVNAAYLGQADERPAGAPAGPAPAPGATLLEAVDVAAGYGAGPVIHGIDLSVAEGEVVALLGPNGAGKTTTLRALSAALPLTRGTVTALGGAVGRRGPSRLGRRGPSRAGERGSPEVARLARRGLAHVPQGRAVLPSLTVAENLRLAAPRRRRTAAVEEVLARTPALVSLLDRQAGRLSGGEQQILALARAVVSRPRLLLVDELSLGLAPRPARDAVVAVRDLAEGGAGVVLVEQHPGLALEVAHRAVVLSRGRVAFEGTAAELAARPGLLDAAYLGETGSGPSRE